MNRGGGVRPPATVTEGGSAPLRRWGFRPPATVTEGVGGGTEGDGIERRGKVSKSAVYIYGGSAPQRR